MSHREQIEWVASLKDRFPERFSKVKVLEVGSLNINGTIRDFFVDSQHTGIDVGPGPCVDVVCSGHEFDGEKFNVTCSCECFEHNPYWKQTFLNMWRLTTRSGLVFFSCATTGRPEHGTTRTTPFDSPLTITKGWDYYRNLTAEDFHAAFDLDLMFSDWQFSGSSTHADLYFWGIKHGQR